MIFVVLFFEKNIVVYQIFILHKPALLPAKTTLLSGRKDEQTILWLNVLPLLLCNNCCCCFSSLLNTASITLVASILSLNIKLDESMKTHFCLSKSAFIHVDENLPLEKPYNKLFAPGKICKFGSLFANVKFLLWANICCTPYLPPWNLFKILPVRWSNVYTLLLPVPTNM